MGGEGEAKFCSAVLISPRGLHWEDLDEDISIDSLLADVGDLGRAARAVA
jgi:hypothetical protein